MSYEETIINSMREHTKLHLPDRNELLLYLHGLVPITGQINIMYCNAFLAEAVQLLVNAIFLYEDGYFDCAFYSIRQSNEVLNNMLYLSNKESDELNKWSSKESFMKNGQFKKELERTSRNYREVKELLVDYFAHLDGLVAKANKIVHKQGFDTFYRLRAQPNNIANFSQERDTDFFIEFLKHTIGATFILFIVLDPMSLILSDEQLSQKLNYDLLTEEIDTAYFKEYLDMDDIIPQIQQAGFYKELVSELLKKETMLPAVFSVVRENKWDIDALDQIESQLHLLSPYENFMFCILKCDIKVFSFHYCNGFGFYYTSIKSNNKWGLRSSAEFQSYLKSQNRFNQPFGNAFMSTMVMYDEPLLMGHSVQLTNEDIFILERLEAQGIETLAMHNKEIEGIKNSDE